MEDLLAATKELKHPVEGFENTHKEYNNDEMIHSSEPSPKKSPTEEKETAQSKPFQEFDLGGKGHKGNLELRSAECGLWNSNSKRMAEFVSLWKEYLHYPGWKGNNLKEN